jgi:RNA polymerase primary sigma factor
MERDPREQQRTDAERIPDKRPGQLDPDVERLEDVDVDDADDDFDLDDDDIDDELDDDQLEEL